MQLVCEGNLVQEAGRLSISDPQVSKHSLNFPLWVAELRNQLPRLFVA